MQGKAEHDMWLRLWSLIEPEVAAGLQEGVHLSYLRGLHPQTTSFAALENALLENLRPVKHNRSAWKAQGRLKLTATLDSLGTQAFLWLSQISDPGRLETRMTSAKIRNVLWVGPKTEQQGENFKIQQYLTALAWWLVEPEAARSPLAPDAARYLKTSGYKHLDSPTSKDIADAIVLRAGDYLNLVERSRARASAR